MTTGQPIRFPSDRNKYNNECMEALQMQINLNQTNLEVNRLYKETGQLPASTQMQDTRSNEEKLMDIHSLKQSIISDLRPIAEPMFASAVIEGVLNSPLNVNNSLFRYLAQNAQIFAQTLSKKYKFGIAGDANDVEIMVQFLEDAYNKTKNSFQSIKSYINSNTNKGNKTRSNILSENDTDNIKTELTNFIKNIQLQYSELMNRNIQLHGNAQQIAIRINQIVEFCADIVSFLPSSEQMAEVLKDLQESTAGRGAFGDEQILYAVFKLLRLLPRPSSVATLTDSLNKALRKNNYDLFQQASEKLIQLFAEFVTPANRAIMQQFLNDFLIRADDNLRRLRHINEVNTISEINANHANQRNIQKAQKVYVINPANDPVNIIGQMNLGRDNSDNGDNQSYHDPFAQSEIGSVQGSYQDPFARSEYGSENGSESASLIMPSSEDLYGQYAYLREEPGALYGENPLHSRRNAPSIPQQPRKWDVYNLQKAGYSNNGQRVITDSQWFNLQSTYPEEYAYDNDIGKQLFEQSIRSSGRGLKPKRVKKGRGLYSPFGDSEINHKNLENNILTLRRKSKTNYMDLPSKHISKHMKNILHNIVGGKIANFEDINNLNDEERNYLNKVISKTNLQARLSVPAPSKDQAYKDNHQWEVIRGEIMAGNDSHELVKKFKILTMKLTRQGLLPKNEVMELFEDLVNLGY